MFPYELFLILSICSFFVTIIIAYLYKKPLKTLLYGTSVALFFCFAAYQATLGILRFSCFVTAIYNTFRVFLFNEDLTFMVDAFKDERIQFYISALYVLAPVLLIGSIIAYVAEMSSRIRLLCTQVMAQEIFIFSEFNEKSVLLAEDIFIKHKNKAVLVFAGTPVQPEGETYDLVSRAKKCGAICLKNTVTEFGWISRMKKKKIQWILSSEDQNQNLQMGIALNERYRETHKGIIYVFSEQIEAEMLLDAMEKGKLKIRRVNERRAIVYKLLQEHPLYQNHDNRRMHLLVIGAGSIGQEFVKTAAWCGQMEDYQLKITIADQSPDAFQTLAFQCPELITTCDINFQQTDVTSPELWTLLKQNLSATYIVIALPTDDLSSRTAIAVRSYYEQKKFSETMPLIHVSTLSPEKAKLVATLINGQKQAYKLLPFGCMTDLYQEDVILQNELEKKALTMHLSAGYDAKEFDEMEYNRKSSIAAVLHVNYKLHSAGADSYASYAAYLNDPEQKERQVRAEHDRWNAYMRSEGYVSASLQEAAKYLASLHTHKNVMALKHPCLIDFDDLDALSDLVKPYKDIDFKEQDARAIEWVANGCQSF